LQDILRSEADEVKSRKEKYKEEVSSKLSLYRQVAAPAVQDHGDLVRFCSVGREDACGNISTAVGDEEPLKCYRKIQDNKRPAHELSFPANCSPPNSTSVSAPPKLTLVRGSSLSLVDIPTFL
jgi:hypothetical protein